MGLQTTGPIAICEGNLALLRYGDSEKAKILVLPVKHSSELDLGSRLAVDGDDNIYMLDRFESYVYKLSPKGVYMNRFGGEGREHGLLFSPSAITVDGTGTVYVADMYGLQVFSGDGRFLRTFTLPTVNGSLREMSFDRGHNLYAIYDEKLRVLRVPIEKGN